MEMGRGENWIVTYGAWICFGFGTIDIIIIPLDIDFRIIGIIPLQTNYRNDIELVLLSGFICSVRRWLWDLRFR